MKAGYYTSNVISEGNSVIEVINNSESNLVMNLGWIYMKTLIALKSKNTIGVWKLKQLKN